MPRIGTTTLLLLLPVLMPRIGAADDSAVSAEGARFFEAKVRPLLVDQCLKCHGPEKQKGGLRLDSRGGILTGGDTGPAIVPGKPDESLLVAAIRQVEDGPKMPPSKKLPSNQIDTLAEWVKMGAPWPGSKDVAPATGGTRKGEFKITDKDRQHWAFRPIKRPDAPKFTDQADVVNPIDAFVLSGLVAKGLRPNPPATRQELIRRATYDLTGLPPTPQDVDAFLADASPKAYEELIDRLLASPRYGEKWGRHWLDLVRFAETNSYERDSAKPSAWRYRDYVIRSLNADKPYDRFVREHLAGDELADRDVESITATGFFRLGIWDDEPSDREQAQFDALDDLVATTSQVFLGMTVDCARCHDHKLDPIAQKDYYRLVSFFRNVTPYRNGGPTDEVPFIEPGHEKEAAEQTMALEQRREQIRKSITGLESEFRKRNGSDESEGRRPDIEELRYRFYRDTWERLPDFAAIKFEEAGELPGGLFDLAKRSRDDAFGFVFEGVLLVPKSGEYRFHLDSDDGSRLSVGGKPVVVHDGIHGEGNEQTGTVRLSEGRVPIRLEYFQRGNGLGLSVAWSGPGFDRRALSAPHRSQRTKADLSEVIRKDGARVLGAERFERYQVLRKQLRELTDQKAVPGSILAVSEPGRVAPDTFVLIRGNAHIPGDKVEPGFLQVLGAPDPKIPAPSDEAKTSGRRRVLADWIASPENPLTARVIANRIFQHHFGRGLVRSPNNFGLQGDAPTHPELLDWLASELIAQGWHMKPLHRLIMTSNAYRMSSRANPEAQAKDPTNDSLWRFDMRRLTAEEIRDSILAANGTLNLKMYGPGVYPEIPAEVMAGQSVPGQGWGKSPPEEQARRSIYVHVKRSLLLPMLESFDLAETDRPSPVRFSTTQPTQSLAMLNSTFLNAQASLLADRLRREAGDEPRAQVRLALRLVTGREPTEGELARGLDLIATMTSREMMKPEAALRAFCLIALNLNEFLYLN
ncbi:MAG: hypothetical protein JWN86_4024 [Planctomycetota bacterium]|nr:hypothetical protein [Planctomycetota bacterium]